MKFTILGGIGLFLRYTAAKSSESYVLPLPTITGAASFRQEVGTEAFDGVYMTKPNASSYEGWYFDVVSDDGREGFFFQPNIDYGSPVQAHSLQFVFSNGTVRNLAGQHHKLEISTHGDGITVREEDDLYSWTSSPNMDRYVLRLDMPKQGIAGHIEYLSLAPAHTSCGVNSPDSSLFASPPAMYWKNPLPDALAKVDITINGTRLQFTGRGYYDGLFGPRPILTNISLWKWGHVALGDYSIVYCVGTHLDNSTSATGYIAKGGRLLDVFCDDGERVKVTSTGSNDANAAHSQSQRNEVIINSTKVGTFKLQTSSNTQTQGPPYSRWIGNAVGGFVGEARLAGVAAWELMEGGYLV